MDKARDEIIFYYCDFTGSEAYRTLLEERFRQTGHDRQLVFKDWYCYKELPGKDGDLYVQRTAVSGIFFLQTGECTRCWRNRIPYTGISSACLSPVKTVCCCTAHDTMRISLCTETCCCSSCGRKPGGNYKEIIQRYT